MLRTISYTLFFLSAIAIALGFLDYFYHATNISGVYWFNLDKERNIATWFSGILFFLFGISALIAWRTEHLQNVLHLKSGNRNSNIIFVHSWLWAGITLFGILMSLDEITILHENLFWVEVRSLSHDIGGFLPYATQWQIAFTPVILIVLSYFAIFLFNRFNASRLSVYVMASGLICWAIAILLEGSRGSAKHLGGETYRLEVLFEEQLEMWGAILILGSILYYTNDISRALSPEKTQKLQQRPKLFDRLNLKLYFTLALGFLIIIGSIAFFSKQQLNQGAKIPTLNKEARQLQIEKNTANIWFDDLINKKTPDKNKIATSMKKIKQHLLNQDKSLLKSGKTNTPVILFLSISNSSNPANVFMGRGLGLESAINNALMKVEPSEKPFQFVKLDVVYDVEKFSPSQLSIVKSKQLGIAFDRNTKAAFINEEVSANKLMDNNNILRKKRLTNYFALNNPRIKRRIFRNALQQKKQVDYVFKTMSYAIGRFSDSIIPLYSGHRIYESLDSKSLLDYSNKAAEYLTDAVLNNGMFDYAYDYIYNESKESYNILRHSGTIFSMLEVYEQSRDDELLDSAKDAIAFLIRQIKPSPQDNKNASVVVENNTTKLGGNGLAIVALAKYADVSGDNQYNEIIKKLANQMVLTQRDNGSFLHKQRYSDATPSQFRSQYYPGEAILALSQAYKVTQDETYLDTAEKNIQYLINIRDKSKTVDELIHDHWLLYGLNAIHEFRPHNKYVPHAENIVQSILNKQRKTHKKQDWIGSYYTPPRTTPTATRSEGLCAAYKLLSRSGTSKNLNDILEAIKRGVTFQLQTQVTPITLLYLKGRLKALGGFHGSFQSGEIRIDYVQHNISSLLCLRDILMAPDTMSK